MYRHIPGRNPFGRTFLSPDDGVSAVAASGENDTPAQPPANPLSPAPAPQRQAVQELIHAIVNSKRVGGDTGKALEVFAGQVLAKDARIAELNKSAGQVPVPVPVQERLAAYEALGTPEELASLKVSEATLRDNEARRVREQVRTEAFASAGYDPEKVGALGFIDDYEYEIKTQRNGETETGVGYARRTVDGVEEVLPVSDLLQARAGALEPALRATPAATRIPAPVMGVSDTPVAPPNPVDAHLERQRRARETKTNPLMK